MKIYTADVAIIGGGFGGVAAALALLEQGRSVVMIEQYPWIGGQVTSQALCVLDDYHDPVGETTGISRAYAEFRRRVRDHYREHLPLSPLGEAQLYLNPGQAICSHLAAEPHIAHAVLIAWLKERCSHPDQLRLFTGYRARSFHRAEATIVSCVAGPVDAKAGEAFQIAAGFFLDATETGETYPLLNIPFRTGSEARDAFDEPHAPDAAQPESLQSFTMCMAVEYVAGGDFRIAKPNDYERWRDHQSFALYAPGCSPSFPARMFEAATSPRGEYVSGAWYYRSVRDPRNFSQPGLTARTIINVSGNDYHEAPFLARPQDARTLDEARHLSHCYLYWLQHEAPRDDGGHGYPEIRAVPEMTGTADGIAMAPYIREGRRLAACTTVTERDLHARFWPGSRARPFADSIGLGCYMIDIHRTTGGAPNVWEQARPYQIPLGALVSPQLGNFAVANKGIGVTQIANGAYRLHPVEWAIGEAAGMLADYMLAHGTRHPHLQGDDLHTYQRALVGRGVPVYWYQDVPFDLPGFAAIQLLGVEGIWTGRDEHLLCQPFDSINYHREPFVAALEKLPALAERDMIRQVYLTAHNARKHDVMQVVDSLRRQGY
jgi:hypothetical protein